MPVLRSTSYYLKASSCQGFLIVLNLSVPRIGQGSCSNGHVRIHTAIVHNRAPASINVLMPLQPLLLCKMRAVTPADVDNTRVVQERTLQVQPYLFSADYSGHTQWDALRMARELQVSPSSTTLRPRRGGRTRERTGTAWPPGSATGADGPCRIASLTASCTAHTSHCILESMKAAENYKLCSSMVRPDPASRLPLFTKQLQRIWQVLSGVERLSCHTTIGP